MTLVPGFGGCRGLGAPREAAVPPGSPQLGWGSIGTPGLEEREKPGEEPEGWSVCGVQAGSHGLQQWAGTDSRFVTFRTWF